MPILRLRKPHFLSLSPVDLSSSNFSLLPGSDPQPGGYFFSLRVWGMFVVFRNVISARFLQSSVPDRQEPAADEAAVTHHQRFAGTRCA